MYKFLIYLVINLLAFLSFLQLPVQAQEVLKGGVSEVIGKGQTLEINLSTPINFYFSQSGDKVAAFLREDILIGDKLFIPKGSRLEGIITEIKKPKKFGQDGAFEIDFNEIVTPDGLTIPMYASCSTDTVGKAEKVAEILSYDAALITYGSFHGFLAGIQYGGVPLAISSHGISLLAGAGVGAGAGAIGSVVRKGKIPTAISCIPLKIVLNSGLFIFGELPRLEEACRGKSMCLPGSQETGKEEYKGFRFLNDDGSEDDISKSNKFNGFGFNK